MHLWRSLEFSYCTALKIYWTSIFRPQNFTSKKKRFFTATVVLLFVTAILPSSCFNFNFNQVGSWDSLTLQISNHPPHPTEKVKFDLIWGTYFCSTPTSTSPPTSTRTQTSTLTPASSSTSTKLELGTTSASACHIFWLDNCLFKFVLIYLMAAQTTSNKFLLVINHIGWNSIINLFSQLNIEYFRQNISRVAIIKLTQHSLIHEL